MRRGDRYDVVIVGAGTAGCVLAARLSEHADRRVLLLEAGSKEPYVTPAQAAAVHDDPSRDWRYPARLTRDADEPTVVSRGRMVGGSGAVNGAMFFRGLPEDYDGWGSPLWSYNALLPTFRRIERDCDFFGPEHGTSGPVPVVRPRPEEWYPFARAFHAAAVDAGLDEKPDLSDPRGAGVGPIPFNRADGRRVSADVAYLQPALGRPNLVLETGGLVTRIRLTNGRADGVTVVRDGVPQEISAGRVVLCAGAIGTPHLLMLSGIGPADALRAHGIPVVLDQPAVGAGASDHPMLSVSVEVADAYTPDHDSFPYFQVMLVHTTGQDTRNDMHTWPIYMPQGGAHPVTAALGRRSGLVLGSLLQAPRSRGEVRLRSADPDVRPLLELNYLEHDADLARFREAITLSVSLLAAEPLKEITGERIAPDDDALESEAAFRAWARGAIATAKHTSGTCRMGEAADPGAVAGFDGAVHGVDGLSIADLSLCPEVVRAPPNNTAFAIGERMAELLAR
jgi:predicted dehydrogenase (TIGR03970 family)